MVNLTDFGGMNEVYSKYFTSDFPARSTIQVAALPKGASVEIEVTAAESAAPGDKADVNVLGTAPEAANQLKAFVNFWEISCSQPTNLAKMEIII